MQNAKLLWDDNIDFPTIETMPYLDTVSHVMIHRAKAGVDSFLLGAAIAHHKGVWYTSWVNSVSDENESDSIMAGKRSSDGGWTWSEKEVISPGFSGSGFHSHGAFFAHGDELWAYTAQHGVDDCGKIYPGLKTEAFILNERTGQWDGRGVVANTDMFWPLEEPKKLPDGNWIMGGAVVDDKCYPAVAIIDGDDAMNWKVVQIPVPADMELWGETTVIVDGDALTAISRYNHEKKLALVSVSHDLGRSWSKAVPSNYPMANSKPYAGMLSTGQRYLISNWPDRNTLTIAVSKPGEQQLSKIWRIRHGASQHARSMDSRGWKQTQWAYPYAVEHEGNLYIVYAVTKEDCELSIVPIRVLEA